MFLFFLQAKATFVRKYSSIRHYSGLQTSQIGLEFFVGPHDFEQGKLKLRCVATISQVYSEGSEELIIGDRGQASGSHPGKFYIKNIVSFVRLFHCTFYMIKKSKV